MSDLRVRLQRVGLGARSGPSCEMCLFEPPLGAGRTAVGGGLLLSVSPNSLVQFLKNP